MIYLPILPAYFKTQILGEFGGYITEAEPGVGGRSSHPTWTGESSLYCNISAPSRFLFGVELYVWTVKMQSRSYHIWEGEKKQKDWSAHKFLFAPVNICEIGFSYISVDTDTK